MFPVVGDGGLGGLRGASGTVVCGVCTWVQGLGLLPTQSDLPREAGQQSCPLPSAALRASEGDPGCLTVPQLGPVGKLQLLQGALVRRRGTGARGRLRKGLVGVEVGLLALQPRGMPLPQCLLAIQAQHCHARRLPQGLLATPPQMLGSQLWAQALQTLTAMQGRPVHLRREGEPWSVQQRARKANGFLGPPVSCGQ